MYPFESMAIEDWYPKKPFESMTVDGTPPPELIGVAVGDMAVLLVNTNQSGLYEISGASSFTVMFTVAEDEPPLLLAQMVKVLSVINDVGVPQMVPLLVPNVKPLGRAGLMAHEIMAPEPARVAFSGKSLLDCPLVSVKFSGEYDNVGTWSFTVRLK